MARLNKNRMYFRCTWQGAEGTPAKEKCFDSASDAEKFFYEKEAYYHTELFIVFGWCGDQDLILG